jgi:hypothetical protein
MARLTQSAVGAACPDETSSVQPNAVQLVRTEESMHRKEDSADGEGAF